SVGATLVVALLEHLNVGGKRAGQPQGSPLRAYISVICRSTLLSLMRMGQAPVPALSLLTINIRVREQGAITHAPTIAPPTSGYANRAGTGAVPYDQTIQSVNLSALR